ncbi:MAG: Zn-ribbon domain-containing OB-fold protein [Hyphomicrobiales bacterium]|nr:Zn-ribbon domain-containing OB-fold protein [Hyphomicrobiales bacterium]
MSATQGKIAAPVPNVETQAYWDGANAGKLLLKKCRSCGQHHFYPRALCPFCYGETDWVEAKGTGEIYSFSVMRRAQVPYAIAWVSLAEGPAIMTNIVNCDFDKIRIGQRVKVTFVPAENGQRVQMFEPAD